MLQTIFERIDPSLEVTDPKDCHLSVFLTSTQLFFTLYRRATSKYVLLAGYEIPAEKPIVDLLQGFDQLSGQFETVSISLGYAPATLVPLAVFEPEHLSQYSNLTLSKDLIALKFDQSADAEMVLVYPNHLELEAQLLKRFPQAIIHHHYWFLLQHDLRQFKNLDSVMIVSKWQQNLLLLAIKNNKLLLCNQFAANTPEELLYYVMNAIEVLDLQAQTCKILLRGELEPNNKEGQLLKQYLADVKADTSPSNYRYSHEFNGLPYNFTELYNQLTCV